ncbi:MAG: thioredoxin domain-containing protein [Cyclobacteriaceae bacterium]
MREPFSKYPSALSATICSGLLLVCLLFSCNSSQQSANKLESSESAYLRMHADNPVDWQIWSDNAFEQARLENKLVIISIGYVSCHWCHVMEKEAFSNDSLASKMNQNFVSVKVDREERPGIDKAYMNAALLINGSGGWPLNVIALPDGRPVFAGTYFSPDEWSRLLDFYIRLNAENPEKLYEQAHAVANGLYAIEAEGLKGARTSSPEIIDKAISQLLETADKDWGGRKGAPKFAVPNSLRFQLFIAKKEENSALQAHVLLTLDKILEGGMYDHLRGGFFRYATDASWRVPHFEKMLYDNAQMVSLYAEAYKLTKKPSYKKAIMQTLKFIEEDLTRADRLFYASVDADSEGEEGKYYLWTDEDLEKLNLENKSLISAYFGIDEEKELDDKNVLFVKKPVSELVENYGDEEHINAMIKNDMDRMKVARSNRVSPFRDDKVITSWNALMISAYFDAYEALGEATYLEAGTTALDQLLKAAVSNDYVSHIPGSGFSYLEDAALLADALIRAYENTFRIEYLGHAKHISQKALETFKDPASDLLFYADPSNENLVVNIHEITDNVMPGSNSQMALNLYKIGQFYYDTAMLNTSERMLKIRTGEIATAPRANSNWGILAAMMHYGIYEIAIAGPDATEIRTRMAASYLPDAIFLGTTREENLELLANKYVADKTLIYVCREKSCLLPVQEVDAALRLMK